MKIGNPLELYRSGAPAGGAATTEADKLKAAVNPSQSSKTEDSATVRLSGGIGTLKGGANADEAFNAKRVEQLKAAIAGGTFQVNAEVVADKVIASNLEALTRLTR